MAIKNHNPRKGTETTLSEQEQRLLNVVTLKTIIPVRGRKRGLYSYYQTLLFIKNHNPRKGTETIAPQGLLSSLS